MKLPAFLSSLIKKIRRPAPQTGQFGATFNLILGGVLSLAILGELLVAYNSLYQNLIFADQSQSVRSANVTRINTENYNLVKARLEKVKDYNATTTIDFLGTKLNTGRSNPFADPE
jgi:hypothetical protein